MNHGLRFILNVELRVGVILEGLASKQVIAGNIASTPVNNCPAAG